MKKSDEIEQAVDTTQWVHLRRMVRQDLDNLIRELWINLNNVNSNYKDLTKAEISIWELLTKHRAIQERLEEAKHCGGST